jgi:phospholipase C
VEDPVRSRFSILAFAAIAFVFQGCSGATRATPGGPVPPQDASDAAGSTPPIGKYIRHIVIVIQENRTVPNLFAGYPGADAPMTGKTLKGKTIPLVPVTWDALDISHSWGAAMVDWDGGKMDGFNLSKSYGFLKRSLVRPYWSMARQYVLADRMFATEFGPSFTAHLDLIASTTNVNPNEAEVNYPDGAWRCAAVPGTKSSLVNRDRVVEPLKGPFPCFDQFNTMAQVLDEANVSWRYYSPPVVGGSISWSAFDAIKYVWGPAGATPTGADWANDVSTPQTNFLRDVAAGKLASVTWVVPDYKDSDHPGNKSDTGPSWVTAIVNSVGQSPDWSSTAIVVLWDDWGGWYDDVPPPQKDFVGLGIRVPCLIISPYAKKGYVSHTQYEFGSVLKFVEQTFNLPAIGPPSFGYTDTRSNSLADSFNFAQKPRPYVKIAAKYPISYFLNEVPSMKLPDDI